MQQQNAQAPNYNLFMKFIVWLSSTRAGQLVYVRLIPPLDRRLMLWSKGKWSVSPKGDPGQVGGLALLTTTGAKSGKPRHTPLGFARDGESLVVLASNAARDRHPAWYFNIRKNPEVMVTIAGGGQANYIAEEVPPGPERERLWQILCNMNPGFEKYTDRTERVMPVIHCKPTAKA